MSLGTGLATLALQTLGVLATVGLIGAVLAVAPARRRRAAAAAVAALATALVFAAVAPSISFLNGQPAVSAPAAREQCLLETGAAATIPFFGWLNAHMPAHARYWLASNPHLVDAPGGLDPLCVAFELLPRLPLPSSSGAGWVVYTGVVTPDVTARIARHDPAVQVFSPGFVLVREVKG